MRSVRSMDADAGRAQGKSVATVASKVGKRLPAVGGGLSFTRITSTTSGDFLLSFFVGEDPGEAVAVGSDFDLFFLFFPAVVDSEGWREIMLGAD